MSNPLVSIIVPMHNSAAYLHIPLQSFMNQSYREMEIILVDDGSTDDTLSVASSWQNKDPRIKVFHKDNGGASSARNLGLDKAAGDYIVFCDSDDKYSPEAINELVRLALINNADIVCCDATVSTHPDAHCFKNGPDMAVLNNYQAMELLLKNEGTSSNVWARLYRSEIFQGLRFPEGRVVEDAATSYRCFAKANRVVFTAQEMYTWCRREQSVQSRKDEKRFYDEILAAQERFDFIARHYDDHLACIAFSELMFDLVHVYEAYIRGSYDLARLEPYVQMAQSSCYSHSSIFLRYLPLRKKIESLMLLRCAPLFRALLRCYTTLERLR